MLICQRVIGKSTIRGQFSIAYASSPEGIRKHVWVWLWVSGASETSVFFLWLFLLASCHDMNCSIYFHLEFSNISRGGSTMEQKPHNLHMIIQQRYPLVIKHSDWTPIYFDDFDDTGGTWWSLMPGLFLPCWIKYIYCTCVFLMDISARLLGVKPTETTGGSQPCWLWKMMFLAAFPGRFSLRLSPTGLNKQ